MSIASYSDLLTSAANWSGRSDLTSRIPEFIALCEAKMNRKLREKEMVTRNGNFPIVGEFVPVPTGFGGVKTFYLNTSPKSQLEFMSDSLMTGQYDGVTGRPSKYNISGQEFRFGPTPDATYSATLVYYMKVPALTSTATTNWMITNHPDAYQYGVLAELAGFAQDWNSAEKWVSAMYGVIDEIKKASNRDSYGGDGALVARPG